MRFPDKPSMGIYFDKSYENEIYIKCLGYNDFNYVKPIKYFRIQHFYTLHIILEGSGTVKVKDKVYKAKKGDMFFIPPEVNLCYYPDEDNLWEYVWFELLGDNVEVYAEKMGFNDGNNITECVGFENIFMHFERIFSNRDKNIPIGYYDIVSLFFRLLDANIRKSESQSITDNVISYIDSHYSDQNFEVSEICKIFNISHSYLCRIFKETYNGSVKGYIIKVRMNEASRLLATTDMSIKEIAYAVGFSDDIHFMKTFKKYKGKTPTEYRKNCIFGAG